LSFVKVPKSVLRPDIFTKSAFTRLEFAKLAHWVVRGQPREDDEARMLLVLQLEAPAAGQVRAQGIGAVGHWDEGLPYEYLAEAELPAPPALVALAVVPRAGKGGGAQKMGPAAGGLVEVPRAVRAPVEPGIAAVERERRRAAEARALAAEGALAAAVEALAAAEGARVSVEARLSSVEGRVRGGERSAKVLRADGAAMAKELLRQEAVIAAAAPEQVEKRRVRKEQKKLKLLQCSAEASASGPGGESGATNG
jgi:hypothetical protein